ncbi:MAG: excisionase family DNA-binding protein [Rhodocyclaceae bacterium]|nr:excisionase family DNA-binding protein [Rhodocyclaceae bacterium]
MQACERRRNVEPVASPRDQEMARAAQRCIVEALDRSRAVTITVTADDGSIPPVELPPSALKLMGQLLGLMSEGRSIVLVPEKQELSTVEAANFLRVSRPFVIKEIEEGRLACRKVGSHRRIQFDELRRYADEMKVKRADALDRMAKNARDLGLDY